MHGGTMSDLQRWYSLDEIAKYLGVSQDTVRRWIRDKDMPAHKVGRLWKFKVMKIDEWVRNQKITTK